MDGHDLSYSYRDAGFRIINLPLCNVYLTGVMSISAGWSPLGEAFYRKFELYSMEWDPNLKDLSRLVEKANREI